MTDSKREIHAIPWPHAPLHRIVESGTFLVTAGTYQKAHHFVDPIRRDVLHRGLLTVARDYGWQLEAWAVFSNHYHFVGHSPEEGAVTLAPMLAILHNRTASWVNRLDGATGRHVWHNYWETRLTNDRSYFARLNYVHHNPVKHGLVMLASQYRWCSASWFERTGAPAQVAAIYRFKTDKLRVLDDYEVQPDDEPPL